MLRCVLFPKRTAKSSLKKKKKMNIQMSSQQDKVYNLLVL